MTSRPLIWDRLLLLTDEINASRCSIEDLEGYLLSIEEGCPEDYDPVNHYAEYVAVMFCRALRQRIDRVQAVRR
ncbi:MAG: hypothetical protein AB7O54_01545 [Pseudomonadales bacterium]